MPNAIIKYLDDLIRKSPDPSLFVHAGYSMVVHASGLLAAPEMRESQEICRQVGIWLDHIDQDPLEAAQARSNALSLVIDQGAETGSGTWRHNLACAHLARMLEDTEECPEQLPIRLSWLADDARAAVGHGTSWKNPGTARFEDWAHNEAAWQLRCLEEHFDPPTLFLPTSRLRNSLLTQ